MAGAAECTCAGQDESVPFIVVVLAVHRRLQVVSSHAWAAFHPS